MLIMYMIIIVFVQIFGWLPCRHRHDFVLFPSVTSAICVHVGRLLWSSRIHTPHRHRRRHRHHHPSEDGRKKNPWRCALERRWKVFSKPLRSA